MVNRFQPDKLSFLKVKHLLYWHCRLPHRPVFICAIQLQKYLCGTQTNIQYGYFYYVVNCANSSQNVLFLGEIHVLLFFSISPFPLMNQTVNKCAAKSRDPPFTSLLLLPYLPPY